MRLHDVGGWTIDAHVNMYGGSADTVTRALESCNAAVTVIPRAIVCPPPTPEDAAEAQVCHSLYVMDMSKDPHRRGN